MRFYTTAVIGPTRELTPEGYLLCKGVPVARTGPMLYAAGEIPVTAKDGVIRIDRTAEQLFRQATIDSLNGKPFTLDHPEQGVDPSNWTQLAKGVMQDARRGLGIDADLLLTDLLVTTADAIAVLMRKTEDAEAPTGLEVSLGYDADYEEIEPGHGLQTNIIANHLAKVDRGRCGTRCAIGDSMKKIKWLGDLRAAFSTRDEAKFETVLKDEPTRDAEEEETDEEKKKRLAKEKEDAKKTTDAIASLGERLLKLETRDAESEETDEEKKKRLAKEKEAAEKEGKTGDSAALVDEVKDTQARAEILSPGVRMPTFDAKATPHATRDALCGLRRVALQKAFEGGSFRDAIEPFVGKTPDFPKLTCDALTNAFIGASEIVRRSNNSASKATFDSTRVAAGVANSINEMNRRNADFWKRN
jgi:hypothetical protein